MRTLFHKTVLATALLSLTPNLASAQWTTNLISVPRNRIAATSAGGLAMFAGGADADSLLASTVVDIYDSATGAWSRDFLSTPRLNLGAAAVGSTAYFGGGSHLSVDSSVVDVYDASTGQWSVLQLPTAMGADAATSNGTRVYFTNGSEVDILDSATDLWTSTTLSSPRLRGVAAIGVGDYVLFAGGLDAALGAVDTVDVLHTPTDTWSVATLSTARTGAACASASGVALFASGSSGTDLRIVDEFKASAGVWSTTEMPVGFDGMAMTSVGVQVFVGGGTDGSQTFPDVNVYDVSQDAWHRSFLTQGRQGIAATSAGSTAVFAGGRLQTLGSLSSLTVDTADVFNTTTGAVYCQPVATNSTGQSGAIAASAALAFEAQGSLRLRARLLPPGVAGIFLVGRDELAVIGASGSQGTLCIGPTVGRYLAPGQVQNSGAGGEFELIVDLTAIPQPIGFAAAQAGDTWRFQAWHRDANPGSTSNFTNAVAITLP